MSITVLYLIIPFLSFLKWFKQFENFRAGSLPLTPGQAAGLQLRVSMLPPKEEQSVPPFSGTGLVQFLVLT